MKPPKCPKTLALIERLNVYLRDNPTCRFKDAAKLLDIKPERIRKWKEFGWIDHITDFALRQQQKAQPVEPEKPAPRSNPGRRSKPSLGVVAPSPQPMAATDFNPDSFESIIARGRDLKISEIRSLVKANLVSQVADAKAVANYAAGLKALSGVQDVELEDIYESEQMVKIYVPSEDAALADVLEVAPIEY